MKKILTLMFAFCLIFALAVPTYALEEGETLPTVDESNAETPEIAEGEEAPTVEETPENEAKNEAAEDESSPDDGAQAEDDEHFYTGWLDAITNSTFWINLGTTLAGISGIGIVINKNFGNIFTLIKNKADTNEIKKALDAAKSEISAEYQKELCEINKRLENEQDNNKKLMAIMAIFITNAKINPCAKAEITKYLSGIKDFAGSLEEIVDNANKAIEAAEAAEEKIETPALDEIISQSNEDIEIGVI